MRFSGILSRAARTEWRTLPKKGIYKPGSSFGSWPAGTPAYLLVAVAFIHEWGSIASTNHIIMEGGVARSPVGTRPREPDFNVIELNGQQYAKGMEHNAGAKTYDTVRITKMILNHPGLVFDHAKLIYYRMIWENVFGRWAEYFG